ncbi:MAG: hypothetical protein K2M68_01680 [Muribaculaceae bacterium]|nr:hypothetical protein [Muribaculaceae bacterium]
MLTHKTILRHYRTAILLVLSTLCLATASAQISYNDGYIWQIPRTGGEAITEPSPDMTAMRKYRDLPISYATGTADMSIPLCGLSSGSVGISLGLSYHTGGIKRRDRSSYIGLGWTLTGLGSISRQINGFPDEWRGDSYDPVVHDVRDNCADVDYLISIIEAKTDAERDMYYYNLPGYSGSFVIINNAIKQLPQTDLLIERIADQSNIAATDAFIITTPDGSKYLFKDKESIDFKVNDSPRSLPYFKRDYKDAVTSWQLSRITGPEDIGVVDIKYHDQPGWTRSDQQMISTDGFSYLDGLYVECSIQYTWAQSCISGVNETRFHNQLVPSRIETNSGTITLYGSRHNYDDGYMRLYIDRIVYQDKDWDHIKTIQFNKSQFEDNRCRLDALCITDQTRGSDGELTDKYQFAYNKASINRGYDLFGYPNGKEHYNGSESIVDNEFGIYIPRQPSAYNVFNNTLKSITDITGVVTTLEYEPATIDLGEPKYTDQLFYGSLIIGPRVKSIKTTDLTGDGSRIRTFIYEEPQCNINLEGLTFHDFLSYNGTNADINAQNDFCYSMGITHLSTLNAKGASFENTHILYGKVTEILNDKFKTIYEYDLTRPQYSLLLSRPYTEYPIFDSDLRPGYLNLFGRYLGMFQFLSVIGDNERRMLAYQSCQCQIREHFGAGPLLKCKTEYELLPDRNYVPITEERHYYSVRDRETVQTGVYSESRMFKYRGYMSTVYSNNIEDLNHIAYFHTNVQASNAVTDSTVVTTYYHVNNATFSRSTKTRYINDLSKLPRTYGFIADLNPNLYSLDHSYPYGSVVSSGDESIASYRLLSAYAGKVANKSLKTLPIAEKWVLSTTEGKDSVQRDYEYALYQRASGFFTRPSRVSVSTRINSFDDKLISEQLYSGYDSLGRIGAMIDAQGRHITAKWDGVYNLLDELSFPDVGLTTNYTHIGNVGYETITSPSGRVRQFSYKAGRLVSEHNTDGQPVKSYSYNLYNDLSGKKMNCTTTTIHDDSGQATDSVYYDAYGNAVRTITSVAGERQLRVDMEYDALNRLTLQTLPMPTDYTFESEPVLEIFKFYMFYDDGIPYKAFSYRNLRNDKPIVITREGTMSAGHYDKFEYLCNLDDVPMYRCRRYRLANSATSETVRLDGFYKAGALDVTKATDPDGCTLLTFTDWRGIKILERRVLSDSQFADTYYLYDVLGNVRVILPPEASSLMTSNGSSWAGSNPTYSKYVYIYRYDRRGNCIYSKVPGGGGVTMRYDKFNRPAFRTSEELDADGACEFLTYDPIGRPAVSGLCYRSISEIPDDVPTTVWYTSGCGGICDSDYSADDDLFNLIDDGKATQVNYYDSYDCLSMEAYDSLSVHMPAIDKSCAPGNLVATRTGVYSCTGKEVELSDADDSLYALYSYDREGRAVAVAETSDMADCHTLLTNTYTRQGLPLTGNYSVTIGELTYCIDNMTSYDAIGNPIRRTDRLSKKDGYNPGLLINTAVTDYSYDMLGRLARTITGNHRIDYGYNLRGQLTSIAAGDLFSQTLRYETGASPCYNGNISEMAVCYSGSAPVTRKYTYDRMNRLMAMTSSDGFNTAYKYNINSSPLTIERYGLTSDGTVGLIDDLKLTYSANRLTQVVDHADPVILENSLDFDKSSRSYTYDLDGRLYSDGTVTRTKYTPSGNPLYLGGDKGSLMNYRYSATGVKLSSTSYQQIRRTFADDFEIIDGRLPADTLKPLQPSLPNLKNTTRYYVGAMEFEASLLGEPKLKRVNMPWGYMDGDGRSHYYIADYQGNIRVVTDRSGNVEQATDYYPYGMPMATSTGAEVNRYKYSGKELETRNGLNFYDFDARLQFHAINLMNQPDVKASDYPWLNPYLYCAANPINITDPTGQVLQIVDWNNDVYTITIEDNALSLYNAKNERVSPDAIQNSYLSEIINENLNELINTDIGMKLVSDIISSEEVITLTHTDGHNGFDLKSGTILYNQYSAEGGVYLGESGYSKKVLNPTVGLCHEMAHAYDWVNGTFDKSTWAVLNNGDKVLKADIFACGVENQYRKEVGLPLRVAYSSYIDPLTHCLTPNMKTSVKYVPFLPTFSFKFRY